jgi:hypothetical protein
MKKTASKSQMLGAFGYVEPDRDCPEFNNDSIAGQDLKYRLLGCLCCDNLEGLHDKEEPLLAVNEIHIRCKAGHILIVAVLKFERDDIK